MTMPGFTAEQSVYEATRSYRRANSVAGSGARVGPAIVPASLPHCFQICKGDPDCLQCCLCIARGRPPSSCCY